MRKALVRRAGLLCLLIIAGVAALLLTKRSGNAAGLPAQVGDCSDTTIKTIGTRLDGVPGSGSMMTFSNGGQQVGYDTVAAIEASRVGDAVRMCLVSLPQNCPPGDNRGRVYRTTNLRTNQSWERADSSHICGGA